MGSLSDTDFASIFSQSAARFLICFTPEQKYLILMKSNVLIYLLKTVLLIMSKNFSLSPSSWTHASVLSSKSFIFLCFAFMIHSEWILGSRVQYSLAHFFPRGSSVTSATWVIKAYKGLLLPSSCFWIFVKNQLSGLVRGYFWVPLFCFIKWSSIPPPMSHSLNIFVYVYIDIYMWKYANRDNL